MSPLGELVPHWREGEGGGQQFLTFNFQLNDGLQNRKRHNG